MSITEETKSRRINLLVSPEEKAAIDAKAKASGLTASELLRRAAETYDPDVDFEAVAALFRELSTVAERVTADLDAARGRIAELEALMDARDAVAADARADLERTGERWPFAGDAAAS